MSDDTIKLIMEGVDSDEGHVDLSLFIKELDTVRAAINCVDKDLYGSNKSNLRLLVSDLSHSSPAATTLTPIHMGPVEGAADKVVSIFSSIVDSVVAGNIPENTNYKALESLRGFGAQVGKKLKSATLMINEKSFDITPSFSRNIANALERGESCLGSVEGALEQINIHGEDKFFTIYPDIGPQKVRCIFPDKLHQEAVNSIEKRVEVSGTLRYRPGEPFPHAIDVNSIRVQPDDSELPTFEDLLGIAPLDDDRSSEEIIGELRNGWH